MQGQGEGDQQVLIGQLADRRHQPDLALGEAFPNAGYEIAGKYEDGDTAIDEGYLTGTHTAPLRLPSGESIPPTGRTIRVRSADIARVEGGVVTRHHFYFDQTEFVEQLGLGQGSSA